MEGLLPFHEAVVKLLQERGNDEYDFFVIAKLLFIADISKNHDYIINAIADLPLFDCPRANPQQALNLLIHLLREKKRYQDKLAKEPT